LNKYVDFLKDLDARLGSFFKEQAEFVYCKEGCSACCEKGDYPLSELELRYLMQGFAKLDNDVKLKIQQNFKIMGKGGQCPFLLDSKCSVYSFRPIICRVHGLAYLCNNGMAKVPYCVNNDLNYSKVYENSELKTSPILENLDIQNLLKDFDYGEIRNLYDWINR